MSSGSVIGAGFPRQLVHGELYLAPLARRHFDDRVSRLEAGGLEVDLVDAGVTGTVIGVGPRIISSMRTEASSVASPPIRLAATCRNDCAIGQGARRAVVAWRRAAPAELGAAQIDLAASRDR